jgi:F-type H+-transporting ATPase subunit delta
MTKRQDINHMKSSAKDLASATLEASEEKGMKTAASGLVDYLKKHHQIKMLPQILVELEEAASKSGIISAKVYSAKPLSDSVNKELADSIKEQSKAREVHIKNIIDKELIGGIKIVFQDKIIDQTIKNRINQLRIKLSKPVSS